MEKFEKWFKVRCENQVKQRMKTRRYAFLVNSTTWKTIWSCAYCPE